MWMRLVCLALVIASASLEQAWAVEAVFVAEGSAPHAPQQPQLAIDGTGVIHLTYAQGDDVLYTASRDEGRTFRKAVKLPPAHDISLGMRRGPRIAVTKDVICISVIGGRKGKGRDGDLLSFRSTDGGETWEGPVTVNDEPDAAREGLHAMASGGDGSICCVWLDLRNRGTEIRAALSKDGGATWSGNTLVYRSPSGSVCECCHPSVHLAADGQISVLFRNALEGNRDMYVISSKDGGMSFGEASKVGTGTWPLKACPMDGGCLAHLQDGRIATAWRRDRSIFFAASPSYRETDLGSGEQPWITATAHGTAVVWLTKRGGVLKYWSAAAEGSQDVAKAANDPVIAAGGKNNSLVAVAWESTEGPRTRIACAVMPR